MSFSYTPSGDWSGLDANMHAAVMEGLNTFISDPDANPDYNTRTERFHDRSTRIDVGEVCMRFGWSIRGTDDGDYDFVLNCYIPDIKRYLTFDAL